MCCLHFHIWLTLPQLFGASFGWHIIYVEKKKAAVTAKYDDHKNALAKEQIQNAKVKEHQDFMIKLTSDIKAELERNQTKKVESRERKLGFVFEKDIKINRLDGSDGSVKLEAAHIKDIFSKGLNTEKVYTFNSNEFYDLVIHFCVLDGCKDKIRIALYHN